MTEFICTPCGGGTHEGCAGGTWCDCQHKKMEATK